MFPAGFGVIGTALKGNPGRFVFHINNAAFQKSVFLQQMAHDGVLPVGVDAEIMGKSVTEIQALFQNAFLSAVAGNPVYNDVGEVILPFSFNCPVYILCHGKSEGVFHGIKRQVYTAFP